MACRILTVGAAVLALAAHGRAAEASPVSVEQVGTRPAPPRAAVRMEVAAPARAGSRTAGTSLEQQSAAANAPATSNSAPLPEVCARAAQAGAPPPPGCFSGQAQAAPPASAGEDLLLSLFGGGLAVSSTGSASTAPVSDANADAVARELGTDPAGSGNEAGAIGARQRPAPSTPPPNSR